MDGTIIASGIGLAGSITATAVALNGQRNANRQAREAAKLDETRVTVDAWVAHNEEQKRHIDDLERNVESLHKEVALCHKEKDEQRDELGSQIMALRTQNAEQAAEMEKQAAEMKRLQLRIVELEKGGTP